MSDGSHNLYDGHSQVLAVFGIGEAGRYVPRQLVRIDKDLLTCPPDNIAIHMGARVGRGQIRVIL